MNRKQVSMEDAVSIPEIRTKQPKELYRVAMATMWFNFSFWGMAALLVVYMVTQLKYNESAGYAVYGTFAALVFGLPLLGGFISDRILGQRKSIIWGCSLQIMGHALMALPFQNLIFVGLAFIAIGAGFASGTDSALVGTFYAKEDYAGKDAGFSILYLSFNIGSALGGLICGFIGQKINWHLGFGLAGILMVFGLAQFIFGISKKHGPPPNPDRLKKKIYLGISTEFSIYLLTFVAIGLITLLFYHTGVMDVVMLPLAIFSFIYIIVISSRFTLQERWKIFAALIAVLFNCFFIALYSQINGSLNLFALRNVNMHIGGFELSSVAFNTFLGPFFITLLIPLSMWFWKILRKRNSEPHTVKKLSVGFLFMGLYFFLLWLGCSINRSTGILPVYFLIGGYFLMELSEVCIGPSVYSMTSKLSPGKIVSTMMGILYIGQSLGQYLAAKIGTLMTVPANVTDPIISLPYYSSIFINLVYMSIGLAVLALVLYPLMKKWMQEVK